MPGKIAEFAQLRKVTGSDCEGNDKVVFEYEFEEEFGRYHIYWELRPRDARNSIWLTQVSIQLQDQSAGYVSARQIRGRDGAGVVGLETDNAFRQGQTVLFALTGYIQVGDKPHVQFCFEEVVRLQ